jgi:hypothetical protein
VIPTQSLQPTTQLAEVNVSSDTSSISNQLESQASQKQQNFNTALAREAARSRALKLKMQGELDKAEATDLYGKYYDQTTIGLDNYTALKGKDAITGLALEKAQQGFTKSAEALLKEASTNGARRLLHNKIQVRNHTLMSTTTSHSMKQSANYVEKQDGKLINIYTQDAIQALTSEELDPNFAAQNVSKYFDAIKKEDTRRLQKNGVPLNSIVAKEQLKGRGSTIYQGAISTFLDRGDIDSANKMLKLAKNQNLLSNEQAQKFVNIINTGDAKRNGESLGNEIFSSFTDNKDILGTHGVADTLDVSRMKKDANALSPNIRDFALAHIDKLASQTKAQADANYQELLNGCADSILNNNQSWSDLPETTLARVKPEDLEQMKAGVNRETHLNTVQFLNDHPEQKTKGNIEKYRWQLSEPKYREMVEQGVSYKKNPLAARNISTYKTIIDSFNNQGLINVKDDDEYTNLMDKYVTNIETFQQENNKFATSKEKENILKTMLANKVFEEHMNPSFFSGFGVKPSDESVESYNALRTSDNRYFVNYTGEDTDKYRTGDKVYLDDIPNDKRKVIVSALLSRGKQATEKNIADYWVRGLGDG